MSDKPESKRTSLGVKYHLLLAFFIVWTAWLGFSYQVAAAQETPPPPPPSPTPTIPAEQTFSSPQPFSTHQAPTTEPIFPTLEALSTLQFAPLNRITPSPLEPILVPTFSLPVHVAPSGQVSCKISVTGGWETAAPLNFDVLVRENGLPVNTKIRVMIDGEIGRLTDVYHSGEDARFIPSNGAYNQYETNTDSNGIAHMPARIRYLETATKVERGKPLKGEIYVFNIGSLSDSATGSNLLGSCKVQVDYIAYAWSLSGNLRVLSKGKSSAEVKPGMRFYPGDLLELGDFQSYKNFNWKNPSVYNPVRTKSEVAFTYLDGTTYGIRLAPEMDGIPTLIYSFGPLSNIKLEEARGYIIEWLWEKIQDKGVDIVIKKEVPTIYSSGKPLVEVEILTIFSIPKEPTWKEDPLHGMTALNQDINPLYESLYRGYFGENWEKPSLKAPPPTVIYLFSMVELSTRNDVLRVRTYEGIPAILTGIGQYVELHAGQEILMPPTGALSVMYTFDVKRADKWWLDEFPAPASPIDQALNVGTTGTINYNFNIGTKDLLPWFWGMTLILTIGGAIGTVILARQFTSRPRASSSTSSEAMGMEEEETTQKTPNKASSCMIYLLAMLAYLVIISCLVIGGLFLVGGGRSPFLPTATPTLPPTPSGYEQPIKTQVANFVRYVNRQDWISIYKMCSPSYGSIVSFDKWRALTVPEGFAISGLEVSKVTVTASGSNRAVANVTVPGLMTPWSIPWIKESGQWFLDCGAQ